MHVPNGRYYLLDSDGIASFQITVLDDGVRDDKMRCPKTWGWNDPTGSDFTYPGDIYWRYWTPIAITRLSTLIWL